MFYLSESGRRREVGLPDYGYGYGNGYRYGADAYKLCGYNPVIHNNY